MRMVRKQYRTTYMLGAVKIKDGIFLGDEFSVRVRQINLEQEYKSSLISHILMARISQLGLQQLIAFLRDGEDSGAGILIHSVKGINRCACALMAYFIAEYKWSYANSLEFLLSRRPGIKIQANFISQLQALEKRVQENTISLSFASNGIPSTSIVSSNPLTMSAQTTTTSSFRQSNLMNGSVNVSHLVADVMQNGFVNEHEELLKNTFANSKTTLSAQQAIKRKIFNLNLMKKENLKLKWSDQTPGGRLSVIFGIPSIRKNFKISSCSFTSPLKITKANSIPANQNANLSISANQIISQQTKDNKSFVSLTASAIANNNTSSIQETNNSKPSQIKSILRGSKKVFEFQSGREIVTTPVSLQKITIDEQQVQINPVLLASKLVNSSIGLSFMVQDEEEEIQSASASASATTIRIEPKENQNISNVSSKQSITLRSPSLSGGASVVAGTTSIVSGKDVSDFSLLDSGNNDNSRQQQQQQQQYESLSSAMKNILRHQQQQLNSVSKIKDNSSDEQFQEGNQTTDSSAKRSAQKPFEQISGSKSNQQQQLFNYSDVISRSSAGNNDAPIITTNFQWDPPKGDFEDGWVVDSPEKTVKIFSTTPFKQNSNSSSKEGGVNPVVLSTIAGQQQQIMQQNQIKQQMNVLIAERQQSVRTANLPVALPALPEAPSTGSLTNIKNLANAAGGVNAVVASAATKPNAANNFSSTAPNFYSGSQRTSNRTIPTQQKALGLAKKGSVTQVEIIENQPRTRIEGAVYSKVVNDFGDNKGSISGLTDKQQNQNNSIVSLSRARPSSMDGQSRTFKQAHRKQSMAKPASIAVSNNNFVGNMMNSSSTSMSNGSSMVNTIGNNSIVSTSNNSYNSPATKKKGRGTSVLNSNSLVFYTSPATASLNASLNANAANMNMTATSAAIMNNITQAYSIQSTARQNAAAAAAASTSINGATIAQSHQNNGGSNPAAAIQLLPTTYTYDFSRAKRR